MLGSSEEQEKAPLACADVLCLSHMEKDRAW